MGLLLIPEHLRTPETPAGTLRLAARGGAALFLEAHMGVAGWQDLPRTGLLLDISLLDPQGHMRYLARQPGEHTLSSLRRFLLACAEDLHPENSLSAFQDEAIGLVLSAVTSDDREVELEVQVVADLEDDIREYDEMNIMTTRAALVAAAQHVSALAEPPGFIWGEA